MKADQDIRLLGEVLQSGKTALSKKGIDTADLDARLLLMEATGIDRVGLISGQRNAMPQAQVDLYETLISRRLAGEPVDRILGKTDFYGRAFTVSPNVLAPRQDTETLIETVLGLYIDRQSKLEILDIGCGSGIIGITLAFEFPNSRVTASDVSVEALAATRMNANALECGDRLEIVESDLFAGIDETFDLIVSNPPYIPSEHLQELDVEVREHDPSRALDGGTDGLSFYRRIFGEASNFLKKSGYLAVEIGFDQAAAVARIANGYGFEAVKVIKDLAGHDRVILAQWSDG